MFDNFFFGLQQDIKLFLFFPILSAIFRIAFIKIYQPYPSFKGKGRALKYERLFYGKDDFLPSFP